MRFIIITLETELHCMYLWTQLKPLMPHLDFIEIYIWNFISERIHTDIPYSCIKHLLKIHTHNNPIIGYVHTT